MKTRLRNLILHVQIWNDWRKHNTNSRWYKFLVLIGAVQSPSMVGNYCWFGLRTGLKEKEDELNGYH